MPGNGGYYAPILEQALKNGQLEEADINACAERLLILVSSISVGVREPYDRDQHHLLAREIAVRSAVLLKNHQVLPLAPRITVAVVGRTARNPRFQGSGSSHVNPTRLPCFLDALDEAGINYRFFEGMAETVEQRGLTDEELQGFKVFDAVLVFAGLPEWAESEGYDRPDMQLPTSDNRLIEEIARVHTRVAVVLSAGAPVEMPWIDSAAAVLHMSLAGQAGGQAAADLIFGKANPSGKLAESYPLRWTDTAVCEFFGQDGKINRYKESIYVGYRYYDTAGVEVLFPFGHGLSYTHFEYSNARIEPIGSDEFIVSAEIRNTGSRDGEEIAQLYVSDQSQQVYRPQKELKGFEKVFLRAGEQQTVRFSLNRRAFAFYHPAEKSWFVPAGEFHILIGASSRDIRLCQAVRLAGDGDVPGRQNFDDLGWYQRPVGRVTDQDFARIYGEKIPPEETPRKGRFTIHSTLNDMRHTWIGRLAIMVAQRRNARQCGGADECNPEYRLMMEAATSTPLIGLALLSHGEMTPAVVKGIVEIANGRILKGIQTMTRGEN